MTKNFPTFSPTLARVEEDFFFGRPISSTDCPSYVQNASGKSAANSRSIYTVSKAGVCSVFKQQFDHALMSFLASKKQGTWSSVLVHNYVNCQRIFMLYRHHTSVWKLMLSLSPFSRREHTTHSWPFSAAKIRATIRMNGCVCVCLFDNLHPAGGYHETSLVLIFQ